MTKTAWVRRSPAWWFMFYHHLSDADLADNATQRGASSSSSSSRQARRDEWRHCQWAARIQCQLERLAADWLAELAVRGGAYKNSLFYLQVDDLRQLVGWHHTSTCLPYTLAASQRTPYIVRRWCSTWIVSRSSILIARWERREINYIYSVYCIDNISQQ